jgi:phage-related holin
MNVLHEEEQRGMLDMREMGGYIVSLFCEKTQWALAFLIGFLSTWWEAAPPPTQRMVPAALALLVLDTVLGGLSASVDRNRRFNSRCIARAFTKFLAYVLALMFAVVLDYGVNGGYFAVNIVSGLIFYREAVSCLEHLEELGLPLEKIRARLAEMRNGHGALGRRGEHEPSCSLQKDRDAACDCSSDGDRAGDEDS